MRALQSSRALPLWIACSLCLGRLDAAAPAAAAADGPLPAALPQAHAHNDYEHPRPLLDALDHGFCSVEADIYLVEGQLLVAHDRPKVRPERTLEALYLRPLSERVRDHGGHVHPDHAAFILLIDFKSGAEETWAALQPLLERYRFMLTEFTPTAIRSNAITVIVSGNRPQAFLGSLPARLAAIDGRLPDLESSPPASLVPLVSDNWGVNFSWRGSGPLPLNERERLQNWVHKAHAQQRRLRFWAAPDTPAGWRELHAAGVDLLSTDDLVGLRTFLNSSGHR